VRDAPREQAEALESLGIAQPHGELASLGFTRGSRPERFLQRFISRCEQSRAGSNAFFELLVGSAQRFLGASALADVREHGQATPTGSRLALQERVHEPPVQAAQTELTSVVVPRRRIQMRPKHPQVGPLRELGEGLSDQAPVRRTQQLVCGPIRAPDDAPRVEADIPHRRQIEQVSVLRTRQLELLLDRAQLGVLQLEVSLDGAQLVVL
jgi:hypothetical protein